jgi:hypothetical protein
VFKAVLLEEVSSAFGKVWLVGVEVLSHVSEILIMSNASEEFFNKVREVQS